MKLYSDTSKRLYRALFFVVCLLLAVVLAGFLVYQQTMKTQMLTEKRVALEAYLGGTAHRPFAYRILVPLTIRFLDWTFLKRLGPELFHKIPPYYYSLDVVLFISLLGYATASYLTYRHLFVSRWWYRALIPLLSLVCVIPFASRWLGHIYDFSLLMFMGILLFALVSGQHRVFLIVFAVSCLNKETTLLMTVAYASYFYDRLPKRQLLLSLLVQCATFAFIYGFLRYHFAANPGAAMDFWWKGQVSWFMKRSFEDLATFVVIVALITFRWHDKPLVLRRASVMVIANVVLFLLGGSPGEMRNFYESLPLLTLFVCRNLELLGENFLYSQSKHQYEEPSATAMS